MKINATIKQVFPAVSGKNNNGEYKYVPIVIEWNEQVMKRDGTLFEIPQELYINIMGSMAVNFTLPVGAKVNIDVRFRTRLHEGKVYNSVNSNFIVLA